MTHHDARAFAHDWASAWNELAVERVPSHVDENVSLTSPTALAVIGVATACANQALRENLVLLRFDGHLMIAP